MFNGTTEVGIKLYACTCAWKNVYNHECIDCIAVIQSFFIAECEITMLDASISSNDLTITVEFAADDPNALYDCKLNNRDFVDCK